jgi:hypothetical protein
MDAFKFFHPIIALLLKYTKYVKKNLCNDCARFEQ